MILRKTTIFLSAAAAVLTAFLYASAGSFAPSGAPGDTMKTLEEIYCAITECSPASYGLESSGSPATTMHTLQEIYDAAAPAVPSVDFSTQRYQVYDDYNCANNNGESGSACAAGDAEWTGEESTWTLYTDASLNGALVASGKVYQDERTGLYWTDCYDSTSGQGSCDLDSNSFTIGTGCNDSTINSGTCEAAYYQTKGNAIQKCYDLSLDSDGDANDETDWRLPTEKELYQAYNDGAANSLPNAAYQFPSATEDYGNNAQAHRVNLSTGAGSQYTKTTIGYIRCVRP